MISKCQKCPPGSYCPGGKAADSHQSMIYECPQGSTSPSGSVSAEACECRRGHFLNVQVSTCSMCPPGYFKNHTGPDLCQTCPPQTVSPEGAIALYECSCPSGKIDIDLSENITCADLTVLEQFVSTAGFLSQTEVLMYSFHGSMSSPESDSLEVVRLNLIDYLVLSARASLHLTPTAGQISYKIMTSEEEEAAKLHAKMDADVFFALASAKESEVTSRSEIAMESLRCPDWVLGSLASFEASPTASAFMEWSRYQMNQVLPVVARNAHGASTSRLLTIQPVLLAVDSQLYKKEEFPAQLALVQLDT